MTTTERLTVILPTEVAAAVRRTVASGEYASPSEVIQKALEDWALQRSEMEMDLDRLRAAARFGLDSGQAIPIEAVVSELRARYASKV